MSEAGSPIPGTVLSQTEAIASIGKMLGSPEAKPDPEVQTQEEPEAQPETEAEEAPQAEAEAEEVEVETSPEDDGEVEAGEALELPGTVEEFAESLGVEVDDLLKTKGKVKINGEVLDVTLGEALQGYQRQSDYDREMQRLAAKSQETETLHSQAQTLIQQKLSQADDLLATVSVMIDQGPSSEELARMANEDPFAYTQALERQRRQREVIQQVYAQRQSLAHQQAEEQRQKLAEHKQREEAALMGKIPKLRSEEGVNEVRAALKSGLQQHYGYTPDQIKGFLEGSWSHQDILVVLDALEYRKLKAGTKTLPKRVAQKARVLKSQANTGKTKVDLRDRLMKAKPGSVQERQAGVAMARNLLTRS